MLIYSCFTGLASNNGGNVLSCSVTRETNGSQWGLVSVESPSPSLFNIPTVVKSAVAIQF